MRGPASPEWYRSQVVDGLFNGTSPSKVAIALDTVAATLEKDLEDERRERKEQVEFLNRICVKERELLVGRAESFQRQLAEAEELWEKERALFHDKLSVSEVAAASAASGAAPQLDSLRLELEAAKKDAAGARSEVQELRRELLTCQAQRDAAAAAFAEVQSRHASRETEAVSVLRSEFAEQRQVFIEEASSEVHALRQQVKSLTTEKDEEHESALRRAVWQLQVADDCVVSLQARLEEETTSKASMESQLLACQRELSEEASSCRRLASSLSSSEQAHELLAHKVQAWESSLKNDMSRSSDPAGGDLSMSQERRQALALIHRLRSRQEGGLQQEPVAPTSEMLWPKTVSVGSSPLRSSPHLRGTSSFLSSLGLPTSPLKEISSSGATALGLRQSQ